MGSFASVPIIAAISLISWRPSDLVTFCKFIYAYFYILCSRALTGKRFDLYDMEAHHDPYKVAFLYPPVEAELESPQSETHLLHAADEVFVYGVNSNSESLVVRIARTVKNEAEAWIFMKLEDGKIYKLHKTTGYENSCSDSSREFTCGGLRMHYINPMRQWRIFYNGILRETSENDRTSEKPVYVKFAFIWSTSSDVFDMTSDVNKSALALSFAKCKWKSWSLPLEKLHKAFNFYAQSGVVHGTMTVDGEFEDRHVYLFGERIRFLGDTCLENGAKFTHVLGQTSKDGSIIHIAEATIPGVVKELKFGFVVFPSGLLSPLSDTDMHLEKISSDKTKDIKAVFHTNGKKFEVQGNLVGRFSHFESNKGWDGFLTIDCLNIQMNHLKGSGVLIKGEIVKPSIRSITEIQRKKIPKDVPPVVHFSDELCQESEITGGKGSSLGKLTQLSKEYQNFIVPNGVVVTTAAFQAFLNKDVMKEIKLLEDVLYGKTAGDLKSSCQRVMDEVVKSNIPDAVLQAVVKSLQKTFGEILHTKKFAVRSSATGEDTEQMSAAGQMDTFLGISGLSEIMSSVKKCWASQFGFIAVQYKRQNGQEVNSPMAVVIQEMVPCDVAGVLFTCDPLTGNPTRMSITANYGLGESVVSGSEEPDTIELSRDEEDKLEIKNKIIGAKSHRIVVRDDEGTSLEDVSEKDKGACCLSDAMALRLGNIAIQIEKSYRSNRDIEWGYWNNNLYIFQSRPVTSGTGETDYEIDHETDGPMRIEKEYFSVCNVGEVMPGALSPLGFDVLLKYFAISFQRQSISDWRSNIPTRYIPKGVMRMYSHAMFYVIDRKSTSVMQPSLPARYVPRGIVRMYNHAMFYIIDRRSILQHSISTYVPRGIVRMYNHAMFYIIDRRSSSILQHSQSAIYIPRGIVRMYNHAMFYIIDRRSTSIIQPFPPARYISRGIVRMYNHAMVYIIDRRSTAIVQSSLPARYISRGIVRMYNHAMLYIIDLMERVNEGKQVIEATMVGLFGRIIEDEDIYEIAVERFGDRKKDSKISKNYKFLRTLFGAEGFLQKALKQYVGYHVPVEKMTTPKEVFDSLTKACDDFSAAMISHMVSSQSSSIWNMIVLNIIGSARGGITPEAYHDLAKLLISISEVESADVPSAMQNLAVSIGKEISAEEFKKMEPEEIVNWLKTSPTEAGTKFRDFLDRHGHRCLKEFDIRSATWGKDPKSLIKLLQNLVGSVSENSTARNVEDFDEILNTLGLSFSFTTRILLKYLLLPKCRKAVQLRERTKSLLIKLLDDWRKGYWHLAKLLVLEGRIPDEDLMFFMTLEEIKELLENRSPRILSRANHRRRRHPILDSYIFPEIMKGFPQPVNLDNTPIEPTADDFKMQGIPVSQGVAKGYVRVALNLEEASHLKKGEILLTYSTDIGWTPYFPSLGGVVTELGGLISHGAVVSREYGLPCIAGLHGATRQFQTGDYVLLDGNKGILQKIPAPE